MNSDVIDTSYIDDYLPPKVSYRTGGFKPRPVIGQNRSFDSSYATSIEKDSQRPIIYESDNGNDVTATVSMTPTVTSQKPVESEVGKKKKSKRKKEKREKPEVKTELDGTGSEQVPTSPTLSAVSQSTSQSRQHHVHRAPSPHTHSNTHYQYPTRTSTLKSQNPSQLSAPPHAPATWGAKRRPPYQYPTQRRGDTNQHKQRPYGYPSSYHHGTYYSSHGESDS